MKIASGDSVLITSSLGSCIAVIIYEPKNKIGSLAHIMHSDSTQFQNITNPAKYADTAISKMLNTFINKGCSIKDLKSYIIGGANMFPTLESSVEKNIGQKNIEAARDILRKNNIKLAGRDTGGTYGRTVEFHINDGTITVKSLRQGNNKLG
ncbi:MAG: chemotaxis protein CheD [Elusimicrobiota bacterium]